MFTHRFFKFFPPPSFLQMPAVGIDISDEAVRFIELKEGKDCLVLGRYGEKKLPPGAVESGYITDPAAVTTVLAELKKAHGLYFVRASLPEEKAYIFQTDVPAVEERYIQENIESKLEENVPISAAEAIFDYRVITKSSHGVHVAVVALPQKVVETYLTVFKDAGLFVVSFESEARAIANALIQKNDTSTHMIINFTEKRAGFFIVTAGIVQFTSTVTVGGEAITESIQKTYEVSREEALKIKNEQGFGLGEGQNTEIFDNALNTLAALKDEINKVFIYWHTHSREEKIESVLLCGKNSLFSGLRSYLATSLNVKVEIANTWINAFSFEKIIPPIENSDSLNYTVPVGLALMEHQKNV